MANILLGLSVVLMLVTAGLGYLTKGKLDDQRGAAQMAQQAQAQTQRQLETTQTDLTGAQTARETAEGLVVERDAQIVQLTTEAETATREAETLRDQIKAHETDLAALRTKLETVRAPGPDGAVDVADGDQQKVQELEQQVQAIEAEKSLLTDRLQAAERRTEELQTEVTRRERQQLAQGLEGRIQAVNSAYGFVVLNLGDRQGIVPNAEMIVTRGGQRIGRVRISSVEQTTSVANIVAGSVPQGAQIQPGDRVIYPGTPAS